MTSNHYTYAVKAITIKHKYFQNFRKILGPIKSSDSDYSYRSRMNYMKSKKNQWGNNFKLNKNIGVNWLIRLWGCKIGSKRTSIEIGNQYNKIKNKTHSNVFRASVCRFEKAGGKKHWKELITERKNLKKLTKMLKKTTPSTENGLWRPIGEKCNAIYIFAY